MFYFLISRDINVILKRYMEFINQIITALIENFDFSYCACVNILTYTIIKILDDINGNKVVTTLQKRIVLVIAIIILGVIYYYSGDIEIKTIINSAILAPVFWSWIGKPICNKLNIDYKKDIDDNNTL